MDAIPRLRFSDIAHLSGAERERVYKEFLRSRHSVSREEVLSELDLRIELATEDSLPSRTMLIAMRDRVAAPKP